MQRMVYPKRRRNRIELPATAEIARQLRAFGDGGIIAGRFDLFVFDVLCAGGAGGAHALCGGPCVGVHDITHHFRSVLLWLL